jgi:hypothetical protein
MSSRWLPAQEIQHITEPGNKSVKLVRPAIYYAICSLPSWRYHRGREFSVSKAVEKAVVGFWSADVPTVYVMYRLA